MIQMVETQYQIWGMTQMVKIPLAHQHKVSHVANDCKKVRNLPNPIVICLELPILGIYTSNVSKPHGEACNQNNTLKDVMEIEWVHSPSQTMATSSMSHYHHVLTQKRVHGDNEETTCEDDTNMHPKRKRKVNTILLILCLLTVSPNFP